MKALKIIVSDFDMEKVLYTSKISRMKLILLFTFLFCSFVSIGQSKNENVTTKKLSKVLYLPAAIRRIFMAQDCGNDSCNEWYANNIDSMFFKNDTVLIYNSAKILDFKKYHNCVFEVLVFSKPSKFSQHTINFCQNNGMRDAETDAHNHMGDKTDWRKKRRELREKQIPHEYNIIENEGDTFLVFSTVSNIKLYKTRKFGKKSYEITLVRQK
jgi:hypothetical protein